MNSSVFQRKIKLGLVAAHALVLSGLEALLNQRKGEFEVICSLRSNQNLLAKIIAAEQIDLLVLVLYDDCTEFLRNLQNQHPMQVIIISDLAHRETMDDWHATMDRWVSYGVRGVLGPDTSLDQLCKAITKVNEGELWLDRFTTSRIISKLADPDSGDDLNSVQRLIERLTERERGILQAILDGEGQALRDISQSLHISEFTLRNHLTAIYSKLNVKNRLDLYVFANTHLKKPK